MIRALAATFALTAALLVGAVPSQAAGVQGAADLHPGQGPWVAVPPPGGLATTASWQLVCPRGVVGGVDARASNGNLHQ